MKYHSSLKKGIAVLLLLCTLLLQLAACNNSSEGSENTEKPTEEETQPITVPEEFSLTSTGGFLPDGNVLRMNLTHENPVLDLSNRFKVNMGAKLYLTSDEAGEHELEKKSITLSEGENVFFVKVSYRKESFIYKAIVNYRAAYNVEFYSNCNEKVETQTVSFGDKLVNPVEPKREGYTFLGWYLNGEKYDFGTAPTKSCTLIAHWKQNGSTVLPTDMNLVTFEGINAAINVVWKDYANANALRPNEVTCVLTQSYGGTVNTYEIVLTQNSVAWKDPSNAPSGTVLTQGEGGDWTLSLKNLPEKIDSRFCNYTLVQKPLTGDYTTLQSGSAAINTLRDYTPGFDSSAKLTTRNARLYDAAGNMIVFKGVVVPNVGDEPALTDTTSVASLQKLAKIGCNGIRITAQLIGHKGKGNGYVYYHNGSAYTGDYSDANGDTRVSQADKQKMIDQLDSVIARATEVGLYTVINWGILASNPYQYVDEACEFFGILAEKHANNPYVLFEICNEPHSLTPWSGNSGIKAYAERVIDTIRAKGSDAIVIVGSKGASNFISTLNGEDPIHSPFDDERRYNVAHTFHCYPYGYKYYYSATQYHYGWRLQDAYEAGLTVITTEMSPMDAAFALRDPLGYDMEQMELYMRLYLEYDLGFFYFRCSSPKSYSEWYMFRPGYTLTIRNWTRDDLSECGKWYYDWVTGDGVFNKEPNYKAPRKEDIVAQYDKTHTAYGLGNVFPKFALSGKQQDTAYYFKVNDYDSLTDIQYETYCMLIWSRISAACNGTAKQMNGNAFTEANVPTLKTTPMELTYQYNGKTYTLKISYGQNSSNLTWGILFDVH